MTMIMAMRIPGTVGTLRPPWLNGGHDDDHDEHGDPFPSSNDNGALGSVPSSGHSALCPSSDHAAMLFLLSSVSCQSPQHLCVLIREQIAELSPHAQK